MISTLILERPSRWRIVGVVALLTLVAAPAAPILFLAVVEDGSITQVITSAFTRAIANSALIASLVGVCSLCIGLPLGVLTALYRVPGRRTLLAVVALPLLLPTLLPAIGWSSLANSLGTGFRETIDSLAGCVFVFCASGVPLTFLATSTACLSLTDSQISAARLAGGDRAMLRYAVRYARIPAALAAALAGILSVSDPAPGQIFGVHTAGAEILTSLAAQYDFVLAARQCLLLSLLILLIIIPTLSWMTTGLAVGLLARQTRRIQPLAHHLLGTTASIGLLLCSLLLVGIPLTGLLEPLAREIEFARGLAELRRTGTNTLLYSALASAMATTAAFLLAFLMGRERRQISLTLVVLGTLFVLPPALGALGVVHTRSALPAWIDPLLGSRFTVGAVLGLRFVPVATLLLLRAWCSGSPSWVQAAAIHGVPLPRYVWKVILPFMKPALLVSVLLVGLLAASDIVTVLLLDPPGEDTLSLSTFTIMANAPESLVATLCLTQLVVASVMLIGIMRLAGTRL